MESLLKQSKARCISRRFDSIETHPRANRSSSDSLEPSLLFELDDSLSEDSKLVIDDILVHHVTRYHSAGGRKSTLNVNRIIALNVDSAYPNPSKRLQVYKAAPPSKDQRETGDLNMWYEVSISSAQVDTLLRQNTALELGNEADWTTERLLQLDAARVMYLPACEMLKQMDGVGSYNNNGIGREMPSEETKEKKESDPENYFFW